MRRRLRMLAGMAGVALLLSACSETLPQNTLDPAGPVARRIDGLFDPVFWIAAAIFFLVEGTLVWILIRFRHRPGRGTPPQTHGNQRLEVAWTIAPALLLAGVAVPTVMTIADLAERPSGDVLQVKVVGYQWWWEFQYPDLGITTANDLHIPEDRPVYVTMTAEAGVGDAVIHSFWPGRLSGKEDVVPGRTTALTLQADAPGVYPAQCAEYCGDSHTFMRFQVIAQTQEDFDAWAAGQQRGATAPTEALAQEGERTFLEAGCIACHAIDGLQTADGQPVAGVGGPNLSHFGSRDCLAGCMLGMTADNVARWLRDPPAVKPGSKMPNYNLSEDQIDGLVAYLMGLS